MGVVEDEVCCKLRLEGVVCIEADKDDCDIEDGLHAERNKKS